MTFRILMVCEGNICRSPLAERLLSHRLAEAGVTDIQVSSAGTRAVVGSPMHPLAAAQLTRLGGDPSGFRAQNLKDDDIAAADLVLTATRDIRRRVLERQPRSLKRTFTVLEFATLAAGSSSASPEELVAQAADRRSGASDRPQDIVDPVGGSVEVHRRVAEVIDAAVSGVVVSMQCS